MSGAKRIILLRTVLLIFFGLCCRNGLALDAEVDWNKAERIQQGVDLLRIELAQPRLMKMYLLRIDLDTPGLRFTGTARDPEWGKPMPDFPKGTIRTRRIRTRNFLLNARRDGLNLIVAANSAPWTPGQTPFTPAYGEPLGVAILDGVVISDSKPHRGVFVVYQDGRVDIVEELPEKEYPRVRLATSGFALILRDGKALPGGAYERDPYPRMAYGLSRDRKYFYILAVDGRQPEWSMGATGAELSEIFLKAGAADAVNMDGGGSTTLCYWDAETEEAIVLTRHGSGGYQRPVGANLGIFLETSPDAGN